MHKFLGNFLHGGDTATRGGRNKLCQAYCSDVVCCRLPRGWFPMHTVSADHGIIFIVIRNDTMHITGSTPVNIVSEVKMASILCINDGCN